MKRILMFLVAILLVAPAGSFCLGQSTMTYDRSYYVQNRAYIGSGGYNDPLYNIFGEVESRLESLAALGNQTTGDIFYVNSNVSTAGDGTSWTDAVETLDEAVALCAANHGDIIYVAPGHNEALIAANGVDLDVDGITVIGVGVGSDRPRFDFDHADGEFVIGAPAVKIYNLTFLPSVTAVTHCIDVENAGDWAFISNCEFLEGETSGTDEFIDCIQVGTTATNVTICNNVYTLIGGTGANNFADLSAATISNPRVYGNVIAGQFAEAGIWAGAAVPTNCFIVGNTVTNLTASQFCIEFQGNATGICAYNICHPATVDYEVDPGTMYSEFNSEGTVMPEGTSVYDLVGTLYSLAAGTGVYPTGVTDDSILAMILSKSATAAASSYNNTTDSLEAISDAISTASSTVQAYQERWISKAVTTIANGNNDLFVVAGGPIKIMEIVAYIATTIGSESCLIGYNVDPTDPATDTVFGTDGTAYEANGAVKGGFLRWDGVIANDLTKIQYGVGLGTPTFSGLIVPAGSIELTAAHDGTCAGAITVYMRYVAMGTGVTVTAAP